MLPALREDITVQGNLEGHKIAMSFDQNSLVHLMSLLTDLYSDPQMAVVREISTNAMDSHIAAGQTRPIEVTTPTQLSHFFKVKDYGLGLNLEDIENVFSLYGASTKRETNDQAGTLGLGCKSPLTYSNSFTVTGIKDGVKTQVSVSREADGRGVMEIVDTTATTEGNGVEIIIPAKQNNSFREDCLSFFRYWPKGSVILDGVEAPRFEGKEICPNVYMVKQNHYYDSDVVVMGNVPYPVKSNTLSSGSYTIVAFVEMGSVNFTPSREELQYTPHTNRTLGKVKDEVIAALKETIADEVKNANSAADALRKYWEWQQLGVKTFNVTDFVYDGETLPGRFDGKGSVMWTPNNYRYTTNKPQYLDWATFSEKTLLIKNFQAQDLTTAHKNKMRKYANANNLNPRHFLLAPAEIGSPWTDDLEWINWDDVNAFKIPKDPNIVRQPRKPESYDVLQSGGYAYLDTIEANDIDKTRQVYYFAKSEHKVDDVGGGLTTLFPDATIIVAGSNRWDKMKRTFPNAIHIDDAFKTIAESIEKMSYNEQVSVKFSNYDNMYRKFKNKTFDDPKLQEFIQATTTMVSTPAVILYKKAVKMMYMMSLSYMFRNSEVKLDNPIEIEYPLFSTYHVNDTVIYCNAKYNSKKEENNG